MYTYIYITHPCSFIHEIHALIRAISTQHLFISSLYRTTLFSFHLFLLSPFLNEENMQLCKFLRISLASPLSTYTLSAFYTWIYIYTYKICILWLYKYVVCACICACNYYHYNRYCRCYNNVRKLFWKFIVAFQHLFRRNRWIIFYSRPFALMFSFSKYFLSNEHKSVHMLQKSLLFIIRKMLKTEN